MKSTDESRLATEPFLTKNPGLSHQSGQAPGVEAMRRDGASSDPTVTEAYAPLSGCLNSDYNIIDISAIPDLIGANSSPAKIYAYNILCAPCLYSCRHVQFMVPSGSVAFVDRGDGHADIFGPGQHDRGFFLGQPQFFRFNNAEQQPVRYLQQGAVTVPQGSVAYAEKLGRSVIMGPGVHMWADEGLHLEGVYDLQSALIRLGPMQLVRITDDNVGISLNNGQVKILEGGKTHLLTHRGHTFCKLLPLKPQTHDLKDKEGHDLELMSEGGIPCKMKVNVVWKITDPLLAAKNACDLITVTSAENGAGRSHAVGLGQASLDISTLKATVFQQAIKALAARVAGTSLTGDAMPAQVRKGKEVMSADVDSVLDRRLIHYSGGTAGLLSQESQSQITSEANGFCRKIGVEIMQVNVVEALPAKSILDQLARQTQAQVQKSTDVTVAEGQAAAAVEKAKGQAAAAIEAAKGEADVVNITAVADASATLKRAQAEAEGIKAVAAARKEEATAVDASTESSKRAEIRELTPLMAAMGNKTSFVDSNSPFAVIGGALSFFKNSTQEAQGASSSAALRH